ncbi:MAG: response regulator transcription factor [Fusobacteriaceae bacterium]|jgi:two-component system LytT family response regulator|nr:response regulator transcription factor [Fusobacteriaceae bacterium]MBP9510252.1 response regulator transcription factor [Fusobacteriaceae bacterium]
MLNCIIVEDEFPAREELKFFIKNNKNFAIKREFETSIDALKFLENSSVDVVFLDINMPGLDGMTLARLIHKIDKNIKLIFITAYREFAVDAFEIGTFDYILKPYSEERIITVLERVVASVAESKTPINKNETSKLTVNSGEKMVVISIFDILYIEANEKETTIALQNESYTSKLKISQLEAILPSENFFRTHRSYIVNIDKIAEVEPWFNGSYLIKVGKKSHNISVSRNNVKKLKEILNII